MIQLLVKDGTLYYPWEPRRDCVSVDRKPIPLLVRYDEGDCDHISWPNPNRKNLHRCLYDDRECGLIGDEEVLLPDGTSAWGYEWQEK